MNVSPLFSLASFPAPGNPSSEYARWAKASVSPAWWLHAPYLKSLTSLLLTAPPRETHFRDPSHTAAQRQGLKTPWDECPSHASKWAEGLLGVCWVFVNAQPARCGKEGLSPSFRGPSHWACWTPDRPCPWQAPARPLCALFLTRPPCMSLQSPVLAKILLGQFRKNPTPLVYDYPQNLIKLFIP